jgi:hypothetical protein
MGFFDSFKEVAKVVNPIQEIIPNELQNLEVEIPEDVLEVVTEFDPTNPDAEFRDEVRMGGDVVLNVVTEGGAGTAFSDGAEGVETLNEFSDNAFTAENIGDAASDFADDFGF